jgi:hypothetical protein
MQNIAVGELTTTKTQLEVGIRAVVSGIRKVGVAIINPQTEIVASGYTD